MRRLAVSTGLTSLGKWGFAVTLSVFAFEHGGARTVGLVALAQAVPALTLAPLLAALGGGRPRREILMLANAARAGILAGVALVMAADEPPLLVFALAVLYSVVSTVNQPARAGLMTAIAQTPHALSAGNAMLGSADTSGFLAGSGFGGLLLATTSPQAVAGACAAAYAVAVVVIVGIAADTRRPRERPHGPLGATLEATRLLARDGTLRAAFAVTGALALGTGLANVLVVVVAIDVVGLGPAGVGELNTAFGFGGLLAGPLMLGLLRRSVPTISSPLGALLAGLPLLVVAAEPHAGVAIAAWAAVGLGAGLTRTTSLTLAQRLVPDRLLAGVLGLLEMTIVAGIGIGSVLAPVLIDALQSDGALVVSGLVLPVFAALLWVPLRRGEPDRRVTAADFRLLRGDPIFAPLSIATVEILAAQLEHHVADHGETIVQQGARGDAYFLVEHGAVEVLIDGVSRRRIGPGGSFGEIALLRDVPRTATVRALEPTDLRALSRERFLLAVTGEPESRHAADEQAERLLVADGQVQDQVARA